LDEIIKKEDEENKGGGMDAFDLSEPVNILATYGPEWQDKISELKNWKEKKDMLEALIKDADVPRIQNGDFSGLIKIIKKLLTDSNAVVAQLSVKASGNLAKGMRKDFEPYCRELIGTLL
jgi:phage terminase large subunit-like protein